jgi:chorismate dehydratase
MEEDSAVDLVKATPTELIEELRHGRLDAALVSSIEAVRVPGYRVVPTLGIACKQEIRSVRAFRRPGTIRSVGLDRSSATSAALLRILLARVHAGEVAADVTFSAIAPTVAPAQTPYDLVLLIGDHGLAADPGGREVWDLGAKWRQLTGLPFVFAVWLLRDGVDAGNVLPVLQRARKRGMVRRDVDGTFGAAHYDLDAEDRRGLHRFWAEAKALGLAAAAVEPTFVGAEAMDTQEGLSR